MDERGPLEIQAYDELCLPGLTATWAEQAVRRPFVGALTLELPTDADDEVLSWIAAGTPPIYFGFGSAVVKSPAEKVVAMISAACAQLGERALICTRAEWRSVLTPEYVTRARAVATQMTKPAESVASAADLLEDTARIGRFG